MAASKESIEFAFFQNFAYEQTSKAKTEEEKVAFAKRIFLKSFVNNISNLGCAEARVLKSEVNATSFRKEGNTAYEQKDFEQALILYTKCIATAPESSALSLAFASRSTVLQSMGKLEECLEDIQRALRHGYPETLRFKLFLREAQCYHRLSQLTKSLECLQNAMSHVDELGLSIERKEQLKQQIKMEFNLENRPIDFTLKPKQLIPTLSYGINQEAPSASDAVRIEYNETYGRLLVATRDIETGDVLMVDKPFATCLDSSRRWSHCNHCLMPSYALLPCPTCDWALYCSENCRDEAASKYHRVECNIIARYMTESEHIDILGIKNKCLLIRVIATVGIENLESFIENTTEECCDPRTRGFNSKGQYDSSDFNTLYNLVSNYDKHPPAIQFEIASKSIKLLKSLGKILSPNANKIAGLFFRLYFTLGNNSHSLDEIISVSDYKFKIREIGSGIFPTASLANNSCDPNTTRIAYGTNLVFRAIRPIKKGTQITSSYAKHYYEKSKNQRNMLLKYYMFECKCEACVNDWPLMENLPEYPTFSSSEKQLESKFFSAKAKFSKSVMKFMRTSQSVSKAMFLALQNNKSFYDEQISLLHSHGKHLNKYYVNLQIDQVTYYQTLAHQHKF